MISCIPWAAEALVNMPETSNASKLRPLSGRVNHYDPPLEVTLAADTWNCGVRAIVYH